MTETDTYLDRLRAELVGVAPEVSREIIAGIREELAGLDAQAAAARIDELGDPAFVAAEARAASAPSSTAASSGRGYIIVTGLLIAIGGIILPFLGWVVGLGLMWASKSWLRWEKLVATLTPPVVVALTALLSFAIPVVDPDPNPLVPAHLDVLTISTVAFVLVPLASGIWLIVRALRRNTLEP